MNVSASECVNVSSSSLNTISFTTTSGIHMHVWGGVSTGYFYFQATHNGNRRNRCSFVIGSSDPLAINTVASAHPGCPVTHRRFVTKMASEKTGVTPISYFPACYVTTISYKLLIHSHMLLSSLSCSVCNITEYSDNLNPLDTSYLPIIKETK